MTISSLKELSYYISSDAYRYLGRGGSRFKLYLKQISFRYLFWMRLCCYLKHSKILFPFFLLSYWRLRRISYRTGIQIPYSTQIGPGFYIGHFGTIVVNSDTIIGKNVNISPGVNIGVANRGNHKGTPVIGDEVYIAPGAKIVGRVIIGNNVAIGANAVVTKDIPDNACVGGVPAKIISMDGAICYVNRKI